MNQHTPNATTDRRTCYVGAKVTPIQRETIRELAARCGMTVSDYLLARSHDYEPKHRLTNRQTESLATLNNCRCDIINYTSALRGMTVDRRRQLFKDCTYMLGWLNELRRLAKRITAVLDELCKPNPIPEGTTNTSNTNSEQ